MTSRKFVTQATPEGSDCVAASSTPEGIAMLTGMGWSHPLLGALPLGLVRALHSCMLKRAVLTDQDFAVPPVGGDSFQALVPQWARGYEEKPTPVVRTVFAFRYPVQCAARRSR